MTAVNKHIVSGRVGRKPELRYTQNGTPVTSISVARQPRHLNKVTNQWEDGEVTWYEVTAFNRLAENVANSLDSGIEVTVIGEMKKRSYQTREGVTKEAWDLQADDITVSLDHQIINVTDTKAYGNKGGNASAPVQNRPAAGPAAVEDVDAPF